MLSEKQAKNFKMDCAKWLEKFLKPRFSCLISEVYKAGKDEGFTKAQIKAARAWHGKSILTEDDEAWRWDF